MAQNWLLKTEPKDYSYENLERDRCTIWDGVSNRLALKHLNQMDFGDQVFIYHTGRVRAIIGIADVVSSPYPDPEKDDPKLTVVDVEARKRLDRPVTLKEVKADPRFSGFILVRLPRLSVMPVSDTEWQQLLEMSGS
jgi:predicted RNA-binding protein with PUA-like domain